MMWLVVLAVFLVILAGRGRIGPFLWDPRHRTALTGGAPRVASGFDDAERILAQRYADGELSTDEYYERLSLLRAR